MSDLQPFEWFDSDFVRTPNGGHVKPEAIARYRNWVLETGHVTREAILDGIVSKAELVARDWEYDPVTDDWNAPKGANFLAITRSVVRGDA